MDVVGLTAGVTAISAGGSHTCALTSGGAVKCWGNNSYGQLGNGTTTDCADRGGRRRADRRRDGNLGRRLSHLRADQLAGPRSAGVENEYGQLGNGTTTNALTAVDVVGLTAGGTAISAGGNHTCALTSGGAAKCWGSNCAASSATAHTTDALTAVDVVGLTAGVTAISAGGLHTCALTSGGAVKCWGWNYYGQLGNGTTTDALTAVDVVGLTAGVTAISAGGPHTCALTSGGAVKCWG